MKITRLYTDTTGTSHFESYNLTMDEQTGMGFISNEEKDVSTFYFQNTLPHQEWEFRSVTKKIYILIISGEIELEVSDGEKRGFKGGDVVLLDDHTGKGHKAKTFDSTVCIAAVHMN